MRVHRKIIPVLGAAVAAGTLLTAGANAPAATTGPAVALTGYMPGNPKVIAEGETVTFVFTETSVWPTAIDWFIQPFHQAGLQLTDAACTFPNGNLGGGGMDGWTCEPDLIRPAQTTTLVLTTHITGAPGSVASVKVCAYNGGGPGGDGQPCKTLSVPING